MGPETGTGTFTTWAGGIGPWEDKKITAASAFSGDDRTPEEGIPGTKTG